VIVIAKNNTLLPGRIIVTGHPETKEEWQQYYNLRYEILRKPWNQPAGSERVDDDDQSIHYCLTTETTMMGICRLHFNDASEAQIRFMGIDEAFRGLGIGNLLMQAAENECVKRNIQSIFLQARDNAVHFYEKNGYQIIEPTFLLFNTIQHYSMRKYLR
jgi:ribosomal protein S18 acetylase RimI-like enzyme